MGGLLIDASVLLALYAAVMASAVKICGARECLAIFRLGKFLGLRGPGLVIAIPFVDRVVRVNLDQAHPGWESVPLEKLKEDVVRRLLDPKTDGARGS